MAVLYSMPWVRTRVNTLIYGRVRDRQFREQVLNDDECESSDVTGWKIHHRVEAGFIHEFNILEVIKGKG